LKGSSWNQKWCLEEPCFKGYLGTFIGSFKNYLRKWFLTEPWFERFFEEPEMVLQSNAIEEPFPVPDGTRGVVLSGTRHTELKVYLQTNTTKKHL